MISTNDLRTGLTIDVDGEVYSVVEFQHVKPGKGAAFVRTKLKNMRTGRVVEQTFRAGEKVNRAHIERKEMQYLYREAESIVFMDNETYEQVSITEDQLGDNINYLQENMNIFVLIYNGELMGIDLPHSVELKVATTEPGVRGDTASGATKSATLETGLVIQVPLFVDEGDIVKVDTKTGEYLERV
ncbi:MAG: elongation factor P [Syntrophaceticus sp.]|jgi:elongation factor P